MEMNIFIVGLRRSGTTIFWRMFRDDKRFLCFDEPFNPALKGLPKPHPKGTRSEFIELYRRDPVQFRKEFYPIPLQEELKTELSRKQKGYLEWLLHFNQNTVCDFTRCAFKLSDLHDVDSGATVIHLHRQPQSLATSHLLPSGANSLRRRVGNWLRRVSFWWRKGWYDNWGFETVIGDSSASDFGQMLRSRCVDAEEVFSLPAVGRVIAYWVVAYETIERLGPALFGERFVSIPFERFCQEPENTLKGIYESAGLGEPPLSQASVHRAKRPYRPGDRRWHRIINELRSAGLQIPTREDSTDRMP